MNEKEVQALTTSRQGGMPAITTKESLAEVIYNDARYPKYRDMAQHKRIEWLSTEIKTLATITRMKDFDGREAVATAVVLDEMMMQEPFISELKAVEIHTAFRNGVFGLYGEFYGISAPNLYGFLNSYLTSDKKIDANKIVRQKREAEYRERQKKEREEEQARLRAEIEKAKRDGTFVPTKNFKEKFFSDLVGHFTDKNAV